MDLRHAIPEYRKLINFLKPLLNAEELLSTLADYEKKEKELEDKLITLEKNCETKIEVSNKLDGEISRKTEAARIEGEKLKENIRKTVKDSLKTVEDQIAAEESRCSKMKESNETMRINIEGLKTEERELTNKVRELKRVLGKSEAAVA